MKRRMHYLAAVLALILMLMFSQSFTVLAETGLVVNQEEVTDSVSVDTENSDEENSAEGNLDTENSDEGNYTSQYYQMSGNIFTSMIPCDISKFTDLVSKVNNMLKTYNTTHDPLQFSYWSRDKEGKNAWIS